MISTDKLAAFTTVGLDGYTITHLARWVETHRTAGEAEETLNKIYDALVNDPRLIDDHSWAELERMAT